MTLYVPAKQKEKEVIKAPITGDTGHVCQRMLNSAKNVSQMKMIPLYDAF